jgi:hypothetical protein
MIDVRAGVRTLAAAGVLWAAPGVAGDTLTGEIVDLSCYLAHPDTGRGRGHRKCAETCLKKGLPAGILTDDKKVYLLLEDHQKPEAYEAATKKPAETVTVEGTTVVQGGVQGIVVEAVK